MSYYLMIAQRRLCASDPFHPRLFDIGLRTVGKSGTRKVLLCGNSYKDSAMNLDAISLLIFDYTRAAKIDSRYGLLVSYMLLKARLRHLPKETTP